MKEKKRTYRFAPQKTVLRDDLLSLGRSKTKVILTFDVLTSGVWVPPQEFLRNREHYAFAIADALKTSTTHECKGEIFEIWKVH